MSKSINYAAVLLGIGMILTTFAFAAPAKAAVCGDGTSGTVVCENGNPEMVVSVWGTTNSGVPHIQPGQYAADGKSLCPAWFSTYCVDITGTAYYRALFR